MTRNVFFQSALLVGVLLIAGCSGDSADPVAPSPETESAGGSGPARQSHTNLWGYFDVYMDLGNRTAAVVPNRQAMFTLNAVRFINSSPSFLSLHIKNVNVQPDYADVDVDVSLTHPFPGQAKFNGYDVRAILMGNGSAELMYGNGLAYPVLGTDQFMLSHPTSLPDTSAPDGYSRWFNLTEFSTGGMPIFSYTRGNLSPPSFSGTATLCPYKYYADGLEPEDDLWTWLTESGSAADHGVFNAGSTNTRNFLIRFPKPDLYPVLGYAIIADWQGVEPQYHPANAPEAIACSVEDHSDVYYFDPDAGGGWLRLDISLWNWSAERMAEHRIFIESTVLSNVYELNAVEMTPVGGSADYSTYHVEIRADNVTTTAGNEFWVIVENPGYDYGNDFGVSNLAEDETLAAFFRYDLFVRDKILPTSDIGFLNFCVVGDDTYWNAGVYFHYAVGDPPPGEAEYYIYRYPLDYSGPPEHYLTLTGNYGYEMNELMGGPRYPAAIEVPPEGGAVWTSGCPFLITWTSPVAGDCVVFWCSPDSGGKLTQGWTFFETAFFDIETEFGLPSAVWGYWGNQEGSGTDGATGKLLSPYGAFDFVGFAGYYPADHVGSVDGLVSDMEAYRHAVDSDPQGLPVPYDMIFYYAEGPPDDPGIEIIWNKHDEPMPMSAGTIDHALEGAPVDISVVNSFGNLPGAEGNWLCVLEDNGNETWQVAVFTQNGDLVMRYPTEIGDPIALDCDNAHQDVHVWARVDKEIRFTVISL